MRIEVLDKNVTEHKKWFLGKISLWDYLSAVKQRNFEFDVQRGIVKNKYLDSILKSVSNKEAFPPITITVSEIKDEAYPFLEIENGQFDILDGLQRTYRLWIYKKIAEIANNSKSDDMKYDSKKILTELKGAPYYTPGVVSVNQIKSFLDTSSSLLNVDNIEERYKQFSLYVYIWSGLSEKEVVKKMLVLNAGQRKVSIAHQYELMYLHIFKNKVNDEKVTLFREKDPNFGKIKSGTRSIGQLIFSSAIIGIQSLITGEPIRLSADNLEMGVDMDDDYVSDEQVDRYFNKEFLNVYFESLYAIDLQLSEFDELYLKWFIKDTTISGLMGAVGCYMNRNSLVDYQAVVSNLIEKIKNNKGFSINDFYREYNNLSSQKINIGDKVRKAIFNYTIAVLNGEYIDWSKAFTKK